jgi:hypothetical protein
MISDNAVSEFLSLLKAMEPSVFPGREESSRSLRLGVSTYSATKREEINAGVFKGFVNGSGTRALCPL